MLLAQILSGISYDCSGDVNIDIADIVYDSRKAAPGTLFVALCGAFSDGHDYAEGAYLRGARAFLVQKDVALPADALVVKTADTRAALAVLSGNFFGHPDRELAVIGVTGTKGKTTVTHMMRACLDRCGIKSGVIGTVGAYYGDTFVPTVNTTPESYETQKLLREMADAGCRVACMEVSSLGLKSHRVDGIRFHTAVFTNLSPDHIGGAEHDSFEEYAYWKKQLFHGCGRALLNADDPFSQEIIAELDCPYQTFSVGEAADFSASDVQRLRADNFFGVGFTCHTKDGAYPVKSAMPGFFSVYNALAAFGVCVGLDAKPEQAAAAMAAAKVRGRNECIEVPADYDVIIDYAHNGQSFRSVIDTFAEYDHNRIITVFGSVGDRAQLRRREMGEVSGRLADLSVVTTDDPGFEDPQAIAEEIASYVKKAGGVYRIIVDREQAVACALSEARKGDIVLILGKGHETYQKVRGEKVYYSDHEAVAAYFAGK
ncbi:MAG: UDP-N-acetylmuramoyl-L-alanyl-D-glutamate--2,6-diaminopimelate ligase [Clostridia bacterium]|nr:UDP-N-acetylmuramoyl-L-alanyl-D-glutamate--2,6-diaminopimelate ligase [Clostridia bacterium]